MAMEERKPTRPSSKRSKKPSLRFFYLDGDLHKVLSVTRAQDLVVCWNYTKAKRVGYIWSDVRRRHDKAFTMKQVSVMLERHRVTIERDILRGNIRAPQASYSLSTGAKRAYYFSEQDVLDLHDYLLTVNIGKPRPDGVINPKDMVSRNELKAMMKNDVMTYVKNDDGEFIPVWREQGW